MRHDGSEYTACPSAAVGDLEREAFMAWDWMQRGFLPHSGGVYDQPHLLLTLIETIDGAYQACRKTR